jgi:hypothetical protein
MDIKVGPHTGPLTPELIHAAFEQLSPAIVGCFDQHHEGRVANLGVSFQVTPSGEVRGVSFAGYAGITSPGLRCVIAAVSAYRFPEATSLGLGHVVVHLER